MPLHPLAFQNHLLLVYGSMTRHTLRFRCCLHTCRSHQLFNVSWMWWKSHVSVAYEFSSKKSSHHQPPARSCYWFCNASPKRIQAPFELENGSDTNSIHQTHFRLLTLFHSQKSFSYVNGTKTEAFISSLRRSNIVCNNLPEMEFEADFDQEEKNIHEPLNTSTSIKLDADQKLCLSNTISRIIITSSHLNQDVPPFQPLHLDVVCNGISRSSSIETWGFLHIIVIHELFKPICITWRLKNLIVIVLQVLVMFQASPLLHPESKTEVLHLHVSH